MVAILIAVIVLIATLIAAGSLMRSTDTNSLIIGAIGFRQGVLQEAERAYAVARDAVPAGEAAEANAGPAYFASMQPGDAVRADLPAVLTTTTPTAGTTLPAGATGNTVRYVVERLCETAGPPTVANCAARNTGDKLNGGSIDEAASQVSQSARNGLRVAYRLTVRVDGPRRAQAYVQTIFQ
jgi:hypothetical protein